MSTTLIPTRGARFPGVQASMAAGIGTAQYAMPPVDSQVVAGIPSAPPGAINTYKRPLPVSSSQMIGDVRQGGPPTKIPRMDNVATGQPKNPQPVFGRGLTPSYIAGQVSGNVRQQLARVRPADKAVLFNSITRTVNTKDKYSHQAFLRNQIVFVDLMDIGDPNSGRMGVRGTQNYSIGGIWRISIPKEIIALLSLPILNYILRIGDVIENPGTPNEAWLEPADVLARFRFDGIVRTDAHESSNPAYRSSKVKHYTVTTDGLDPDATNIWGAVAMRQPLYLIVKRFPRDVVPNTYATTPGEAYHFAPVSDAEFEYHPQPMQVVPWSDSIKMRPGIEELKYFDELSQTECMGIAIHVGWAKEASNAVGNRALNQSWSDANALMELPKCHVNVLGYRSDVPV